jgi:hypothetical protein
MSSSQLQSVRVLATTQRGDRVEEELHLADWSVDSAKELLRSFLCGVDEASRFSATSGEKKKEKKNSGKKKCFSYLILNCDRNLAF